MGGLAIRDRWSSTAILSVLLVFLSGCGRFFVPVGNGSGSGGGGGTETVYVANNNAGAGNSDSVSVLSVGSSGTLSALGANLPAGTGVSCMTIAGKFLYVGNLGGAGAIVGFSIKSDGSLTALNAVASGVTPQALASAAGGKFLYALNVDPSGASSTSSLLFYTVNTSTGALNQPPTTYAINTGSPISLRVSPNGNNLYAALGKGQGVQSYAINSDGTLSGLASSPISGTFFSAYDIALAPNIAFAYIADNVNSSVVAFSVQKDGSLQQITGGTYAVGTNPFGMAIDPSGGHIYVSNNSSGNVSAFAILANGALSPLTGSPFAAGSGPRGILADPTGQWVYVANQGGSPDLSVFSESNTGALTSLGSVKTGGSAIAVAAIKQ